MQQHEYVYTRTPMPKLYQKRKYRILCPKCGNYGWVGKGTILNPRKFRYPVNYIRHYSSEVYHRQMVRYRNHEIKSRPNGQKRCYVPNACYEVIDGMYHIRVCGIRHKLGEQFHFHRLPALETYSSHFRPRP
jgi:hypothetical protein